MRNDRSWQLFQPGDNVEVKVGSKSIHLVPHGPIQVLLDPDGPPGIKVTVLGGPPPALTELMAGDPWIDHDEAAVDWGVGRREFKHAHIKISSDSSTTTIKVSDARFRIERGNYAPRGGQAPPRPRRRRTETIEVAVPVQDPPGWTDVAAYLALQRGADLGFAESANQLGTLERRFVTMLTVPDAWTGQDTTAYETDLVKALRYARGMPWLRADALLSLMRAEEAAALVVPGSEDLFSVLKTTPPSSWRPTLDNLTKLAAEASVKKAVELAIGALYAWA